MYILHHPVRVGALLLAQARELPEARSENVLHTDRFRFALVHFLENFAQILAGPEFIFEFGRFPTDGGQHEAALENHDP